MNGVDGSFQLCTLPRDTHTHVAAVFFSPFSLFISLCSLVLALPLTRSTANPTNDTLYKHIVYIYIFVSGYSLFSF